jgi:hypothetical protein
MLSKIAATLSMATVALAAGVSITPHDSFSSSIGVLGCHINTNRVAYWPLQPGCDSLCKKVTSNGRSVHLLHIDTSGGAYDISYDAWNYLNVGVGAAQQPTMGGGIPAEWEDAPMKDCADLITTPDGKLPLSAANSMNTYAGCPAGSWLRDNAALYNIQNSACTLGYNEVCTLDLSTGANQATCAHILGAQNPLSGLAVTNIAYGTGAATVALQ